MREIVYFLSETSLFQFISSLQKRPAKPNHIWKNGSFWASNVKRDMQGVVKKAGLGKHILTALKRF